MPRIMLPNGCSCTPPHVFPANWKKVTASVAKPWYIKYQFYDPNYPEMKKGYQRQIKGMNQFKTAAERREITELYLEDELDQLINYGFNPITKTKGITPENESEIGLDTPFTRAIEYGRELLTVDPSSVAAIKSSVKIMARTFIKMNPVDKKVSEIYPKDVFLLLKRCSEERKLSAQSYNHYREYLRQIFKLLFIMGAVKFNPVTDIPKKKLEKRIKLLLSDVEREKVNEHLKKKHYIFWRYMQVFFHSGARTTELLNVRIQDVDLEHQRYKCKVKKGQQAREVHKTIKNIALPFWEEICRECRENDYLFSRSLKPGAKTIRPDHITKRWQKWVKEPLQIKADFYSLKHLNTTETVSLLSEQDAAKMNAHTSTAMVVKIYDTRQEERQHERLKKLENCF